MPDFTLGLIILALLLLAGGAVALAIVYFRVTGAETLRQQRIRAAVDEDRQRRNRAPLLSKGEVPEDPGRLLRDQRKWRPRRRR